MVDVGQIVSGKYKLLRLLGDGGMGSVYEAEHLHLGTHVALKILHTDLARRAGLIERFLQEARVSAQIHSPHVVQVTDVERSPEGLAYLVMELLQGETLAAVIKREHKLSVGTASEYTSQILEALEAAHSLGVIHRDLKPDNVFVTFQGGKPVLKLIDFGIAKLKQVEGAPQKNLTVAGMLMGTPEYMAPEQAYSAASVDVRADLYAVGCMLYEMLSGQPPVSGEDPRVVVLKVERGEVTPLVQLTPGIAPELAGFVHRSMAPKPELRFASSTEMRIQLDKVNGGAVAGGKRANTQALDKTQKPSGAPGPGEIGSGTVMGAPTPAALASPGSGPPPADPNHALHAPAGGGTLKAPPINPGQFGMPPPPPPMPAYGSPAVSAYQSNAPTQHAPGPAGHRKKGGSGVVIALAVVALLLGAGAVVAYVMSTQDVEVPAQPLPTVATTTPTTPPTTPTTTPTTPSTLATTTPTLTPNYKPPTNPPTNPTAHPSSSAGPHPSASGSAAPPSTTPTGIPPFVVPSSFPNPFPSGFPGLPSAFPTFPPPP